MYSPTCARQTSWVSSAAVGNMLNADYALYGSLSDMVSDVHRWAACTAESYFPGVQTRRVLVARFGGQFAR